jgi:hypothetical protein
MVFVATALLAACAAIYQFWFALQPLDHILSAGGIPDDTFLYLQIARRWALEGVPTFDGSTLTNGVEPLWGLILWPLARTWSGNIELLRATLCICATFNIATTFVLYYAANELANRNVALLACALWSCFLFSTASLSGMEMSLHGFIFTCALLAALRVRRTLSDAATGALGLLGLLLALNGLCRLDSGLISAGLALPFAVTLLRARRFAKLGALFSAPVGLASAYAWANQTYFGTPTPVSGQAKMFWAHEAVHRGLGEKARIVVFGIGRVFIDTFGSVLGGCHRGQGLKLLVVAILTFAAVVVVVGRRHTSRTVLLLVALVALHVLTLQFVLMQFATAYWYYQPHRVVAAVVLGHLALARVGPLKMPRVRLAAFGLAIAAALLTIRGTNNPGHVQSEQLGIWLETTPEIPREAALAGWNVGEVAYFAYPRPVVNLDGLVQSRVFLEQVLRPRAWRSYLREHGIRYLVDYNSDDATQTYDLRWDHERSFRGLVPWDRARIIHQMGPILVVDISGWLES